VPVEKESRFSLWIGAFREWAPTVRPRLTDWWHRVREEPALFFQTSNVRYAACGAAALMAILMIGWFAGALTPPAPKGAGKPSQMAQFHVICDDPACGHHFVIQRKFSFNKFPIECPKCGKKTGCRAVLSTTSGKKEWVIQR
jgi:hypothetical protein